MNREKINKVLSIVGYIGVAVFVYFVLKHLIKNPFMIKFHAFQILNTLLVGMVVVVILVLIFSIIKMILKLLQNRKLEKLQQKKM